VNGCDELAWLWTTCLSAGIKYRDLEKTQLIALIHRDPHFDRFDEAVEVGRMFYARSKSVLASHLKDHGCWRE
jgi:hypothetical protein